jgi:hypothetical protein
VSAVVQFQTDIRHRSRDEVDRRAEAEGRVRDAAEVVQKMEPPSAADLGIEIKVRNLPPARARLARFAAWLAALKAELSAAEQGRAQFLRELDVPAVTEDTLRNWSRRINRSSCRGCSGVAASGAHRSENLSISRWPTNWPPPR